jgi:glycine hydroxymethyltransferase
LNTNVPRGGGEMAETPVAESTVLRLIQQHEERRHVTVNLVASENLMSPAAQRALSSDLAGRYLIPPVAERPKEIWDYPNQVANREIEQIAKTLAKAIFHGAYADVRPLSGNNIAGILLSSLVDPGDTILTVPGAAGGHFATAALCTRLGIDRRDLPYDNRTGRIDIDQCARLAREIRPKFIYLDASMILFPYPVSRLREIFGPDCVIAYDASHCFGLIAGGVFQSPLPEGADLIVGSTHKSMFGPQKGLIVAREDGPTAAIIRDVITPLFVSNAHVHHVAALAIALEELAVFGAAYARRVVNNARALARGLSAAGLRIPFAEQNYTECHQILCRLDNLGAEAAMERLQRSGIHVNGVNTPFFGGPGLRIGLAELTRRGFQEDEIGEVAHCMSDALFERAPEAQIASRIRALSQAHPHVGYGFDESGLGVPST